MVANLPDNPLDFIVQVLATMFGILFNAGAITEPFIQNAVNHAWAAHQDNPLSAELAAVAVLKGWMDPGTGAAEAAMTGIDGSRFQLMVDTEGNPLPVELGAAAVRRGLMDNARFIKLLQESRYRVEWADMFIALQHGPPSPAAALSAAVQGHLDGASAQRIVAEGGIDPTNYDWLYQSTGRPPGTEEMIKLLRRGVVTEADVTTAIQESDVKNKYIPAIIQTRVAIPPLFQISRILSSGAVTPAQATAWVLDDGYDASVAAGIVAAATGTKTAKGKSETEAEIVGAYRVGQIDRATAVAMLVTLGYDAVEAEFLVALEEHKEAQAVTDRATSRIQTMYVNGRIDRATAVSDLSALGVAAAAQSRLLQIWDIEHATVVKRPTVAQLGAMVKKSLITAAEMTTRLVAEGYTPGDAALLVGLY